jgi:hypothetical protein
MPFLLGHLGLPPPELDPTRTILQLNSLTTNSNDPPCPFTTPRHGPRRKHYLSIVEETCLLLRCLAIDVLLLRASASAGMCLPSRCLAMALYVTI